MKKARSNLADVEVHVKFKLAALWASVMFCYVYGDYFQLYRLGTLQGILKGKMAAFGVSQATLLSSTAIVVIPSLMIFLSLALKPKLNRGLNVSLGVIYTIIMLGIIVIPGSWWFYILLGLIEGALTTLIAWYALHWPREVAP